MISPLLVLAFALQAPAFAPASPESQGIEPARLAELGAVVQGYVDEKKIVGAELLVIRNDRVVLHRGYGWKHREEGIPMQPGGVFCLRSQTKAVVGAAVQMLIDEDRLSPRDPVARYLPSFDNERSRAITVEHLLTHTSGLPLSSLIGVPLAGLGGERDVAALAGARGPDFTPGTRYQYSDDGADTLGALVEAVSGKSLENFLRERLLEPLGMSETTGVMGTDHALRAKVCSHYAGGAPSWDRYWSPEDPPLFGFLLGSQGLYGTALDYARFLHLWKEKGRAGGERLLSPRALRSALEPLNDMSMPSGFEGLQARYGRMMQLWVDPSAEPKDRVVAFGHGGSEGTIAWVFPALDLLVLYFTQSRNSLTVIEFGAAVQRCLLDPLTGKERAAPVHYGMDELDDFPGLYWEEDDQEYQAVLLRGATLFVEFPGKRLVELQPTAQRDHWRFRLSPEHSLEFERDPDGRVVAFTGVARGQRERMPRLVPAADLPSVEEVMELRRAASDWTKLEALGSVRVRSTVDLPGLKLHGKVETVVAGLSRRRSDTDYGSSREATLAVDGRAWSWSTLTEAEELSGVRLEQAELDHPYLPVADWRALYTELEVLARVRFEGADAFLLRTRTRGGNAHTWHVAAESGLPLALSSVDEIPGLGPIGSVMRFDDWREVGGLRLPFHVTLRFASSFLGTADMRWLEVETGVELAPSLLDPATLAAGEER